MRTLARSLIPLVVVVALAALLSQPRVATAQIFRWTDADGTIHYSQGIDSVPPSRRASAVIIGHDRPSPSPGAATPAAAQVSGGQITFTPGQPIMVTARINDAGSAQLMLDTGAARTLINPTVLAALGVSYANSQRGTLKGVTGDAEVLAVRVESLEVGGARYGPLLVVSHDTGFGRGDGLLGRDFLDHFTVTIDNTAGLVTLRPK
ncbi:MAG TPA: aspartyl protease family protein [Methylomirabilota bacterium]|jgi:hypothetical protein|nr:aspartyl protease family protein [Methylomirabilota bacterium]